MTGRRLVELPQLYEDFTLLWRDLEEAERLGLPVDLSAAMAAAQRSAKREDNLILFGNKALGAEGLLNAEGAKVLQRGNWKEGETAYQDIAHGMAYLSSHSMLGRYALVLSPELYLDLQRLQPNVGVLEADRIAKLVDGRVYPAGSFGAGERPRWSAPSPSTWTLPLARTFRWGTWRPRTSTTASAFWRPWRCASKSRRPSSALSK